MAEFIFTAKAHVSIRVVAPNETVARAMVFDDLSDADTDFIRSDHFRHEAICAEMRLSEVEQSQ